MIKRRTPNVISRPQPVRSLQLIMATVLLLPFTAFCQCPATSNPKPKYISATKIPPLLRFELKALGDRLEKPNLERLIATGTLTWKSGSGHFVLTTELPNLVRLEINGAGETAVLGFDGITEWKANGSLSHDESGLLESLVYDLPEQFFYSLSAGAPVRTLVIGARPDGKTNGPYIGSLYDVYQSLDANRPGGIRATSLTKTHYVNSMNRLLERVQYTSPSDGISSVQTIVDSWLVAQNSKIPAQVRRIENGVEVARLGLTNVQLIPAGPAGIFCVGQ